MNGYVTLVGETPVFLCGDDGACLSTESDALDIIGATGGTDVDWIGIPVSRLDAAFFDLRTRVAGLFLQKLVNYRKQIAIIGLIDTYTAESTALRDFVRECNRGTQIWFVNDLEALVGRFREAARQ